MYWQLCTLAICYTSIKKLFPGPGWVAQLLGALPVHQVLQVQFLVRARTYTEGLITGRGACGSQLIDISLPLSLKEKKKNQ